MTDELCCCDLNRANKTYFSLADHPHQAQGSGLAMPRHLESASTWACGCTGLTIHFHRTMLMADGSRTRGINVVILPTHGGRKDKGVLSLWRSCLLTYIATREGWLYLAVVEALFSRMVVGWSMAETLESRWVVDALEMAMARRRPDTGLLAHADRGSQYASAHYWRVLAGAGIACSRSAVGQCWDNAPVGRLFGRLKCEIGVEMFESRDQARKLVFEYLEVFDNRVRRHSALGYVSPAEFERAHNQSTRSPRVHFPWGRSRSEAAAATSGPGPRGTARRAGQPRPAASGCGS